MGNIGIDCKNAKLLQSFYSELLGWEKCEMYGCPAVSDQSGLVFLFDGAVEYDYIKPEWPEQPSKQQKQMHFDFKVDELPTAVIEAEAIRLKYDTDL